MSAWEDEVDENEEDVEIDTNKRLVNQRNEADSDSGLQLKNES